MKLTYRDIEPFVKNPNPAARVILVYGPDIGLVKERAEAMCKTVVSDIHDPFNVATLSGDDLAADPARLSDEAHAISMMGGDRLIHILRAEDKITPILAAYLESPSSAALVIIQADNLSPKSKLRKLCEKEPNAAAMPCYVEDERDIGRLIRTTLQAEGYNIAPDAAQALASNIVGDRQKARREIEKLMVYKGADKTPISYGDVQEAIGDAGAITLDNLIYATAGGNTKEALKAYHKLIAEDVNFIVTLRSVQNHFRRLHFTRSHMEQGLSLDAAAAKIKPKLFFKVEQHFKTQMQSWNLTALSRVLMRLGELEAACKQTGAPVDALCAQALLSISRMRRTG